MDLLVCFCVYLMYPHYFSCFFVICLLPINYLSVIYHLLSIYLSIMYIYIYIWPSIYLWSTTLHFLSRRCSRIILCFCHIPKNTLVFKAPWFLYWRILFQTKVWVQRCLLIMGHHFFFFFKEGIKSFNSLRNAVSFATTQCLLY